MQLTAEELGLLKGHCEIDRNSEDGLLEIYYSWTFHEIVSAVTDEPSKYIDWFRSRSLFARAIYPLASHYLENHIVYLDRDLLLAPHMVLSTVYKLKGLFGQFLEDENDEI